MSSRKEVRNSPLAGSSGKILGPRSDVWQFFQLNRDTRRAQCNFCQKILAYTGGTTNLRYHLTAAHAMEQFEVIGPSAKVFKTGKKALSSPKKTPKKRQYKRKQDQPIAEMPTTFPSTPPPAASSFSALKVPAVVMEAPVQLAPLSEVSKQQPLYAGVFKNRATRKGKDEGHLATINDGLLQMMIKSLLPLEFVASGGFKEYMNLLEPSYQLPEKHFLKNKILTMYENCKMKLKERIRKDVNHFSLSYDVWKGSDQEAYTTVIIHYLTDNWELKSYVIGTGRLSQMKVSGAELSSCIQNLLFEYDLTPESLIAAVSRQGQCRLQVEQVGSTLECESMSCASEKLDLCVQAAFRLPEVREVIDQVGRLANYLDHDKEASRMKKEELEREGYSSQMELFEEQKGSWIATSDMLIKVVSLRDVIKRVGDLDTSSEEGGELYLDADGWYLLENMVSSLQILRAALSVMSNERTGSVSCLLPVVHSILQHCEDASHIANSTMDKFLKTVGKEVREKWDLTAIHPSSVAMLSALLDPRFKKLKFIAEEDQGDVLDALRDVLKSSESAESAGDGSLITPSTDATPFLCLFGGAEDYVEDKQDLNGEIKNYMAFPALRHDSCQLDWWRVNRGRFPQLAGLARQYLSVPAVTRAAGDIVAGSSKTDMKRALLETEIASSLIFLNRNISLIQA